MNCQTCSSEMIPDDNPESFYCHQCDQVDGKPLPTDWTIAIQPSGNSTDFHCPNCVETNLEVGTVHKAQVCFCNNCRGFVIDSESFGELVRVLRAEYVGADDKPKLMDQSQLRKQRPCPACFESMNTHPYYGPGNVVIDSCLHCKLTWLDHKELTMIQRAPGRR